MTRGERASEDADEREVLAAFAGGSALLVFGVGHEAFVPADDAEGAVARQGGVDQRLLRRPRVVTQHVAALQVVERIDDEVGARAERFHVRLGDPHAERLRLHAEEREELGFQRVSFVLADRGLHERLRHHVLRLDAVEVDEGELGLHVPAEPDRGRAQRAHTAKDDTHRVSVSAAEGDLRTQVDALARVEAVDDEVVERGVRQVGDLETAQAAGAHDLDGDALRRPCR